MTLSRFQLQCLTALWLCAVFNLIPMQTFWHSAPGNHLALKWTFALGGALFVATICLALVFIVSMPFRGKWIRIPLFTLIWVAAALSFFTMTTGMQFDRTMLDNLLQTDAHESLDLITPKLLAWLALTAGLPSFALWRWRSAGSPAVISLKSLARPTLTVLGLSVTAVVLIYAQYARYASAVRNHHITFHTIAPANLLAATISQINATRIAKIERAALGSDAALRYPLKKP